MKKRITTYSVKHFLILFTTVFSLSAENLQALFFSPAISASMRLPIGDAKDYWEQYNSAGFNFEFPSKINNLLYAVNLEAGRVFGKNDISSAYLLHIHFGAQYLFSTPLSFLKILPQICLTNTMVSSNNSFDAVLKKDRISFADVENEYGIRIGIEPRLVFGNFFFGIPVIIERTFSTPDPFDLFLITVNTGYTIRL